MLNVGKKNPAWKTSDPELPNRRLPPPKVQGVSNFDEKSVLYFSGKQMDSVPTFKCEVNEYKIHHLYLQFQW